MSGIIDLRLSESVEGVLYTEQANRILDSFEQVVTGSDGFSQKVDTLLLTSMSAITVLLEGLSTSLEFRERVEIAEKLSAHCVRIENSLYKRRAMEAKEEIDVTHIKFQKVLEWFVEVVLDSLDDCDVPDSLQAEFTHIFAMKMGGFEEVVNKKLRGVSFANVPSVQNPLVRKFMEERVS